ncbi:unnamed protein product [Linum trigynum]|uniref:Uncharacterized protein n=1 Tax=Linum trigynum TaxID=586398 RepID=A0AAV2FR97_9ROSI
MGADESVKKSSTPEAQEPSRRTTLSRSNQRRPQAFLLTVFLLLAARLSPPHKPSLDRIDGGPQTLLSTAFLLPPLRSLHRTRLLQIESTTTFSSPPGRSSSPRSMVSLVITLALFLVTTPRLSSRLSSS